MVVIGWLQAHVSRVLANLANRVGSTVVDEVWKEVENEVEIAGIAKNARGAIRGDRLQTLACAAIQVLTATRSACQGTPNEKRRSA